MAAVINIQQQAPSSRFSRLTLVWVGIAILVAGTSTSFILVKFLIERDQQLTAGFIGSYLEQAFDIGDFQGGGLQDQERYITAFSRLQRYHQVERLVLYNTSGVVVWSNQGNLIGKSKDPLKELKAALEGSVQFDFANVEALMPDDDGRNRKYYPPWISELLLPVHDSPDRIIGVAQITWVPKLLFENLLLGLLMLWGILFVSGGIYYLLFNRLFTHTSNELISCEIDLEKSRRLAELGECVSMIVHDTRNLMASIQFILERLRSDQISVQRRDELINSAKRPIQMSFAMMEDLLAFVSGKKPPLLCHKHHLKQLLVEGRDMLMAMLEPSSHQLVLDIPDDLIIYWDAQKLLHILVNLVRNASESMDKPGKVSILATRDDGGVRMRVRDTGRGIPEKLLPNLFEPFISETGKNRPGLGLAIIRDLVRRHGGEVVARNWEGGAEFDLYFPDCPSYEEPSD